MTLTDTHTYTCQSFSDTVPSSEPLPIAHTVFSEASTTSPAPLPPELSGLFEKSTPTTETVYTPHVFTTAPTTAELKQVVRDHLASMIAPSYSTDLEPWETPELSSMCAYRGDHGSMCAVGVLIANQHYGFSIEQYGIQAQEILDALRRSLHRTLTTSELDWLLQAQKLHDDPESWTPTGIKPHLIEAL